MEYKAFCKIGFSGGMGIIVNDSPFPKRALCAVDFDTGDCEDKFGIIWEIDQVERFFYFDGTPVKGQDEV